jgi:hypothetical protein
MFEKQYMFRGQHAERVVKLTAPYDPNSAIKIFERNLDVYIVAPIIGFLFGRKAEIDKTADKTTSVFPEQILNEQTTLKFNYRIIMLLDQKNEPDIDERINKAFRYSGRDQTVADEELYNKYVLGGVDVLFEKIFEPAKTSGDYIKNLYDFIEEFNDRFNEAVTSDSLIELCRLARS